VSQSFGGHGTPAPAGSHSIDPEAVFFADDDYAGFWRRLAAELAYASAILILLIVLAIVWAILGPAHEPGPAAFVLCGLALVSWYFVFLKHSRVGTVGYRLARIRIVDVRGGLPSLGMLSVRPLFAVFGPFNVVLDLLWIPSDRRKQSLRDKVTHTYVVKASARPAGPGRIVYRPCSVMGMSWVFQEIEADQRDQAARASIRSSAG
jgi:uncharacterized RDD family membrane protein YckC